MNAAKEGGRVESRGLQSDSGGSTEDQHADSPNQPKSRSGPEFLGLSRCAACYNHKANSMFRRGGDGESSSSAEDSGPEVDSESEAESSSSSCCSGKASSEVLENPPPVSGDAAEPEPAGEDGNGQEETGEASEEDESRTKGVTQRAPFVKSLSLPTSSAPHLSPLPPPPRPHTVVSTLRLQVLPQKHHDDGDDAFCIIKQHLPDREQQKTWESNDGGREGINNPPPPETGLPWQRPLLHQHQQQQPPHFPPLSAQGQSLPPPLHAPPGFHPPALYPPQLTPQPCWCCYSPHSPPPPYWSHYSSGQ